MLYLRKLLRNPALLLAGATLVVVVLCLIGFGAAHQGQNSATMMGMPRLWFSGLVVLPVVFFVLLTWVWKRHGRIAR